MKKLFVALCFANVLLFAHVCYPKLFSDYYGIKMPNKLLAADFLTPYIVRGGSQVNDLTLDTSLLSSIRIGDSKKISKLSGYYLPDHIQSEVPIAVVIENTPISRPQQSGLKEASIVFEALAEGGITRFLAILSPSDLDQIGPVRSARPYFVRWAEEFGGVFVHAGGSNEAFSMIYGNERFLDLNENDEQFWRDKNYSRPHNLFTDMELLKDYIEDNEWTHEPAISYLPYSTKAADLSHFPDALEVDIDFSLRQYEVTFSYDPVSQQYQRLQAGKNHHDIAVDNLIVMFTDYYPYDDQGRLTMKTLGTGDVWYFMSGKQIQGSWQKYQGQKTRFFDTEDEEMIFSPGKTWIAVIDNQDKVVVLGEKD